jgi:hypothetical protein
MTKCRLSSGVAPQRFISEQTLKHSNDTMLGERVPRSGNGQPTPLSVCECEDDRQLVHDETSLTETAVGVLSSSTGAP